MSPPFNQSKSTKKMRHQSRFFRKFPEGGRFTLVCDLTAESQQLSIINFRTTMKLGPGFREEACLLGTFLPILRDSASCDRPMSLVAI